jgi:hypothetical protein
MHSTRNRRFTLIDAIALIAATAIGLALLRPALSPLKTRNMTFWGRWPWIESSILHGLLYATPVLFAWSVATLALRVLACGPLYPFRAGSRSLNLNYKRAGCVVLPCRGHGRVEEAMVMAGLVRRFFAP